MHIRQVRAILISVAVILRFGGALYAQSPLGTGFAYQGQLEENGAPLTGTADLRFSLHDALTAKEGQQVGSAIVFSNYQVSGGVFAVELDFGVAAFNGQARFLQIEVRSPHDPSDTEPYTTLEPRLPVSATPYALQSRGLYVDEEGNLSIGDAVPSATAGGPPFNPKAHSATALSNGVGMFGEATSASGVTRGVWGKADSPDGQGVAGESPREGVRGDATGTSGNAVGIKGTTASPDGRGMEGSGPREGVRGHATETAGDAVGMKGTTASPDGRGMEGSGPREGVRGEATETSGDAVGMKGTTASPDGRGMEGTGPREGVRGEATETTGNAVGMKGTTASPDGRGMEGSGPREGVRGEATETTGNAIGMKGTSASPDGRGMEGSGPREGVRGEATETTGTARGVCGISASTSGEGVFGHATATAGALVTYGVHGRSDSMSGGRGVFGEATAATNGVTYGVYGTTQATHVLAAAVRGEALGLGGNGVYGVSSFRGVFGEGTGAGNTNYGVSGLTSSLNGFGIYGQGPGSAVKGVSTGISGTGVLGQATSGTGTNYGVRGISASDAGLGVYGEVTAVSGGAIGVYGYSSGINIGVKGRSDLATGIQGEGGNVGVEGIALNEGDTFGVHGRSSSQSDRAAGVWAQGNGSGLGTPRAAALRIESGAITVGGGGSRPAGRVLLGDSWTTFVDQSGDRIGFKQDVEIFNDLIVGEGLIWTTSMIWATVEIEGAGEPELVYGVHVFEKNDGSVKFRVAAVGCGPPPCPSPAGTIRRYVSYLIINPLD